MTTKKFFSALNVKRAAFVYFVGLAILNLLLTWYNYGFKSPDLITLLVASLPFIINKKIAYLFFGLFGSFISAYLLFAWLTFSLKSSATSSTTDSIMGLTMIVATLFFSIGLMYVGMQSQEKDRFSLI